MVLHVSAVCGVNFGSAGGLVGCAPWSLDDGGHPVPASLVVPGFPRPVELSASSLPMKPKLV